MLKIMLCRWVCMAAFFCLAQVVVAASHNIGLLGEELYRDRQTFSYSDVLDERNETYEDVLTTLKSCVDEDLLDKILDEVDVYAHYYSFTPEIDGVVRICEYSNLTTVPDRLKNVSKSDLKNPLKAVKIIKEAIDAIKSGDLYFVMVNNDDSTTICDVRDEMPVYRGNEYDIAVFSFKKGCVGKSFSFSLCLEGYSDEPTYKVNLHKNADSSRWQFKFICGTPLRFPDCKSDLGWTRDGYEFQGWAKSARGDVDYGDGDEVSDIVIEDGLVLNFYAVWDLAEKDVFFDANGGYVDEVNRKVKFGKTVGNLPIPILSKHKFLGWYTAVEGGTKISAKTKVNGNVTYYAQWAYNGLSTVSVAVADGCEAMGKVSGGKTAKAGTKLTLKATANKGYVFSHWEGPLGDVTDPRSPSITYTVGNEDAQFTAHFIPLADDVAAISFEMLNEYATGESIASVAIDVTGCTSLPKVTVKGLPSGLKFTAKDVFKKGSKTEIEYPANTIYGTPTKSGVYTIVATVTTAGKKMATYSQTIIVRKPNEKVVVSVAASEGGDVKGGGVYAVGKKVTLKATAKKGFVFAGWYEDDCFETPCDSSVTDYRNPSYAYTMGTSDKMFYARFAPSANDTILDLTVDGYDVPETFTVSEYAQLALDVESLSLPKISVKGLPAGMKFTAKPIYKKGSKTEIEVPANTIYGTPTKPDRRMVSVSISNTSIKKAIVKEFTIEVPNLTAANGYFVKDLDNGIGKKCVLSVGISNIDDFLPSLELKRNAKLMVSGLPAGLKYDAKTGKITGVATKPGTCTVTLTVTDGKAKYVSTITVEVEALPDWVVGTFEGYLYCHCIWDDGDYHDRVILTISSAGKVSCKGQVEDTSWYVVKDCLLIKDTLKGFVIVSSQIYNDVWDESFEEYREMTIVKKDICGQEIGFCEGVISKSEMDEGVWCEMSGYLYACQNVWASAKGTKLAPEFVKNTTMTESLDEMRDDEWDPCYGGNLTLTFGSNGAVTTAYSEREGSKTTANGSAQLVPYDVDGNITKAWLYTALKPKGRDPFGVLLFLEIDTSRGIVYGEDIRVADYLLEIDD